MEFVILNNSFKIALFSSFASLVPEEYKPFFLEQNSASYPSLIALGVLENEQPIALILANHSSFARHISIHFIHIVPPFYDSLALPLFSFLEKEAAQRKVKLLTYVYSLDAPETPTLEKAFSSLSWNVPRPFMVRCLYDGFAFDVPWITQNDFAYPPGCEEFLWKDIKEQEKHELHHIENQGVFSSFLSPFRDENKLEPLNSLGVRYQGKVVGWMLTHRIDPQTIRYTALFISPSVPQHGRTMATLLSHSIQLHMSARTPWALLEIPLLHVRPSWSHFVERRLIPYADKVTRLVQSWKNFA